MRFLVTPGQSKTQAVSTIGTTVMDWYSREKILAERILARVHVAKLWSSIEKSPVYIVLDRQAGRSSKKSSYVPPLEFVGAPWFDQQIWHALEEEKVGF